MNTRGPERKADDPRPNLPPARSRAQIPGLSRQFQAARAAGIPASQKAGGSKERPSVPARPRRALPSLAFPSPGETVPPIGGTVPGRRRKPPKGGKPRTPIGVPKNRPPVEAAPIGGAGMPPDPAVPAGTPSGVPCGIPLGMPPLPPRLAAAAGGSHSHTPHACRKDRLNCGSRRHQRRVGRAEMQRS